MAWSLIEDVVFIFTTVIGNTLKGLGFAFLGVYFSTSAKPTFFVYTLGRGDDAMALPFPIADDKEKVKNAVDEAFAPPPMYKVLLVNDDYTTMDFVVVALERFFFMDEQHATRVMLEVHMKGTAVCGVFTREIAETKVAQVMTYAVHNEQPLLCTMEAIES